MFFNITDASRAVGVEQNGEQSANPVGKQLALLYIPGTLGAGAKPVCLAARTYLTPLRPLVLPASGAFTSKMLAASSAIKAAGGYFPHVGINLFHKHHTSACENSPFIQNVASLPTKCRRT